MINNIKLKYDSIVYHNVYGLGNIRGQITDNNKRMVKFKNTSTTNEIELNDLTIPHQINTSIYYDNEMFNIMDIYIENGILQYKIINSCESKNININDKNIHKKFKEGFEYLGFGNYISVKDRKTGQVSPLNGNANFFKRK